MTDYIWVIDKQFDWEMGHRVWSQQLDHPELSISVDCCCKHLHGHSYSAKVLLGSNELDQSSMVTDFKNLNFVKKFVDGCLDHKFMIDINDPHFEQITGCPHSVAMYATNFTNLGEVFKPSDLILKSHIESFVLVNFVPTSENICKYLALYVQEKMPMINVVGVELWETKKSHCKYIL